MDFDPYRRWLGVSTGGRPPNHYALLGLSLFEEDADAISNAADRQMSYVRQQQTGPHAALTQTLLNELAAARVCLLDAVQKARYDAELKAKLAPMPLPVSRNEPSADQIVPGAKRGAEDGTPSEAAAWRRAAGGLPDWAIPAACGLAAGLLLALIGISLGAKEQSPKAAAVPSTAAQAAKHPKQAALAAASQHGKSMASARKSPSRASLFKSIAPPSPLGVTAEKLVIWNAHSGPRNDVGALECNVRLLAGGRETWSKQGITMPWAPNEDRNVTLVLPPERFDRIRVEITRWEKQAGGLAEIQVVSADGRNLALGCPTRASGVWHERVDDAHVTDGMTSTAQTDIGAWLLPPRMPGWVEVDLSLPRPGEPAGVTADKLVIWNQHNGPHNNHGALECTMRLLSGSRDVWVQRAIRLPWTPNEDRSLSLPLPAKRFDRARVEITKWERNGGGLAEIQLLSADGRNLARDCPTLAVGVSDHRRSGRSVTDGIVSSGTEHVGYWLLPNSTPGWIDVDLACLDPQYGAACRRLGLARALVDGDWQSGLPWLARGDDQALRRLALADMRDVRDAPEQLALADAWWDLAQQAEGEVRQRLLARALWRYRQALAKLREFRKVQVQARVDEALAGLPERDYLFFMSESAAKLRWGNLRDSPISVRGVRSYYSLWHHAGTKESVHVAFPLGKRYRRFRGAAAFNDSAARYFPGTLTFRIVGEGRELWKSPPMNVAADPQAFDVDVAGVDKLELYIDCPGANPSAHSVWVEPRLER